MHFHNQPFLTIPNFFCWQAMAFLDLFQQNWPLLPTYCLSTWQTIKFQVSIPGLVVLEYSNYDHPGQL